MNYRISRLAATFFLAACGADRAPAETPEAAAAASPSPVAATPAIAVAGEVCRATGALRPLPDDVHEASGAAASRTHPGVFWTHNDSGEPELFAIDAEGRLAGRVRVRGAEIEDWEDIALAPCPTGGDCLYIADIGDNDAERPFVTVYRVPEPAPGDAETRPAAVLQARYPDGSHDAEALFVLPDGSIHILTKGETGPIALYRFPTAAQPGQTVQLERVREIASGEVGRSERITGADASPDGRWIAVRTLHDLALYPAGDFLAAAGSAPRRTELRALGEAQGEGVAFASDGALLLTSEGGKKKDPATFARVECALE